MVYLFRDNNRNLNEHKFLDEKAFRNSSTCVELSRERAWLFVTKITRPRVEVHFSEYEIFPQLVLQSARVFMSHSDIQILCRESRAHATCTIYTSTSCKQCYQFVALRTSVCRLQQFNFVLRVLSVPRRIGKFLQRRAVAKEIRLK